MTNLTKSEEKDLAIFCAALQGYIARDQLRTPDVDAAVKYARRVVEESRVVHYVNTARIAEEAVIYDEGLQRDEP